GIGGGRGADGTGAMHGASRRPAGAAGADSANHAVVERSRSARQHWRENGPFPIFMKIIVCVGTGGVGKTSVAASIALTEARAGAKCLVLTTDPSHRLRTALGLKDGLLEQRVPVEDAKGELWAALLDVNATLDEAVRLYGRPGDQARILQHPIYRTIASSLSGMQELMAVERMDQ